jgi:hypothetical protein
VTSLLVAILGPGYWYFWLLPLGLFCCLLLRPLLPANRHSVDMVQPPVSAFGGDFRSSTGILSLYAQELKSQPGVFSFKSQGDVLSVKHQGGEPVPSTGLLADETPVTPVPDAGPLVRVLETYDLRSLPVEHFLQTSPREEVVRPALVLVTGARSEYSEDEAEDQADEETPFWQRNDLPMQDFPRSEPGEPDTF